MEVPSKKIYRVSYRVPQKIYIFICAIHKEIRRRTHRNYRFSTIARAFWLCVAEDKKCRDKMLKVVIRYLNKKRDC